MVKLAMRLDRPKKPVMAAMSQISSSESSWPRRVSKSSSQIYLLSLETFMAKSSMAICRGVMSALR